MKGNKAAGSSSAGSQGMELNVLMFVLVKDALDCVNLFFRQSCIQ